MKQLVLSMLLLYSFFGNSQELDCSSMKTGTFSYPGNPGKVSKRTESEQLSFSGSELNWKWDVVWLNDCEYEIICKKVYDKAGMFKKGDKIRTEITSIDGNCYSFKYYFYRKGSETAEQEGDGVLCKE